MLCNKWHWPQKRYISVVSIITFLGFSFSGLVNAGQAIKYAPNPSYNNMPITPKTWEQADLVYYSNIHGHRYTNMAEILRPISWLHKHHMDTVGAEIRFSIPEFSIINVIAIVKAIKPTQIDTRGIDWSKQKSAPVIGKFVRYVTNVRTYTLKDKLGHISRINATPNHPFYVENKKGFIPIKYIKTTDNMVSIKNHVLSIYHLVHDSKFSMARNEHLKVKVFNIELYRNHNYKVGKDSIVVHNQCGSEDPIAEESFGEGEKKYILSPAEIACEDCENRHPRYYLYKTIMSLKRDGNGIIDPYTRERIALITEFGADRSYMLLRGKLIEVHRIEIEAGRFFHLPSKFQDYEVLGYLNPKNKYTPFGMLRRETKVYLSSPPGSSSRYYSVANEPFFRTSRHLFAPNVRKLNPIYTAPN